MTKLILPCLALSLCLAACSANADPKPAETGLKPQKQVIIPKGHQETYDTLKYAPAMRVGDMVYLSGVVVTLKDDETATNITPAVERAFDEIEAILNASGGDWSDAVDVTSFYTDLDAHLFPMWDVKEVRVPAPYPAWTAIGVDRLYGGDNAIIEIKVTAYIPE